MKNYIVKALNVSGLTKEEIESLVEVPKEAERGEYAFPCFSLAKSWKKNPAIIAQEIAGKIKTGKEVERVEAVGPYINFFVNRPTFARETLSLAAKKTFGRGKEKGTIVMDYSHPNVAKHFGVHNLRSTLIGHAIYNILTFSGKKVISVNHLGDWGTQFGKLIVAYKLYGNKKSLKDIASLNALYIKFHDEAEKHPELEDKASEEFKKLEDGNKENIKLWKEFLDISLKEFMKTYKLLDITFDQIKGESFYRSEVKKILERLSKKGILEESEGAQVVKFDDIPPAIIAKSDEASTYATRDVAAVFERLKENPEKILYIVDVRQSLHFEQVFRVAEKLGVDKDKLVHVKFGLMKFPDMEMSTRKGKVVLFEYLLEKATAELVKIIKEKNPDLKNKEKIAQQLALASIVFNDVQNNRIHDVVFNWEQALNFEGKAAPYILYTYVRALSILNKSKVKLTTVANSISNSEFSLIKKIAEFPDTVQRAAESYEPHIIAEYAYQLSQGFNEFYHADKVVGSDVEGFRVALVSAFSRTLKNALYLLGIQTLEEM
jgi:arginyl-tRNA synthetase